MGAAKASLLLLCALSFTVLYTSGDIIEQIVNATTKALNCLCDAISKHNNQTLQFIDCTQNLTNIKGISTGRRKRDDSDCNSFINDSDPLFFCHFKDKTVELSYLNCEIKKQIGTNQSAANQMLKEVNKDVAILQVCHKEVFGNPCPQ